MELASLALLVTVGAGYGVPVDGYPSKAERQLLLWTNAARVAPEAFENEYTSCSFDEFTADEQTAKAPLYIDLDLTEVSRWHSEQMEENGCFQHESCDGTNESFGARVARYYDDSGYVGENIAMGSSDSRYAVMGMWMCSSGHRANIMTGDYNEMGPGISGVYLTQDFAAGMLAEGDPPVRVAVDDDAGTWMADWGDDDPPAVLQVVVDGVESDMGLLFGQPEQGIYSVEAPASPAGGSACQGWYVYWETAAGEQGTFPADGSWQFGDCTGTTDDSADWTPAQAQRGGLFGSVPADELNEVMLDDLRLVGCSTGSTRQLGALGLLLASLAGLRRRNRPV